MRLGWVEMYRATGNASLVCRRCGISAPTLRKWIRRYEESGKEGLVDRSRRPNHSPNRIVDQDVEQLILRLRRTRRLGARRLQSELLRHHAIRLALATIHKVLIRHEVTPLVRSRRFTATKRYQRAIPGDRVQMDTCQIRPGLYQYTAVDDCTRYRVLGLYERRNATNTIDFLEQVTEEMYFPIQRVQTDRGSEFFARKVQRWLMDTGIKFRPIKPRSPHLNGKVERSQRTDKEEFWAGLPSMIEPLDVLREELSIWQGYYNWHRPHGSLGGHTPIERLCSLLDETPLQEAVDQVYAPSSERMQERDYRLDLQLRNMKRCP